MNKGRPEKRARRRQETFAAGLDALPDELLLPILDALESAAALAQMARTSRRLCGVVADQGLWRRLYAAHYGPPEHEHFVAFGKDWRWLYRARSHRPPTVDAAADGACAVKLPDGTLYWGELDQGQPHGYGLWMRRRRKVVRRECKDALSAVEAVPAPDDVAERYEGEWRHGRRHGRGFSLSASGKRYEGAWADGVYGGHGICTWSSGARYEGAWTDGLRHGDGTYLWSHGHRYEGTWAAGTRHGCGTYTWPDGTSYRGQWADGKRSGQGVHTSAGGVCYSGAWQAGQPHGQAICTWPNGQSVVGGWCHDNPRGPGVLVTADGRRFEGDMIECMAIAKAATLPIGIEEVSTQLSRICCTASVERGDARDVDTVTYLDGSSMEIAWRRGRAASADVVAHATDCGSSGSCMACVCKASRVFRRTAALPGSSTPP